jgi:antitoxin CcdA
VKTRWGGELRLEEDAHDLERLAASFRNVTVVDSCFLLWYASSMPLAKRKISVSLDQDLVKELEAVGESLSAQVNVALRAQLERRRRRRLLAELLDRLDEEHGPVDEALVEKYTRLLA